MSQQLNLFPRGSLNLTESMPNETLTNFTAPLNAVDEVVVASKRYRNRSEFLDLLNFLARFPNYSVFNCFLLYTQNPSISYVATARTWARRFGRRLKGKATPLVILAPMAPVRFLFDIMDTEGDPVSAELLNPTTPKEKLRADIYENTLYNCEIQGIIVRELALEDQLDDSAIRIIPAIRKKYPHLNLKKDASYLIVLDQAISPEEKYANLALELGHIFCGHLGIDKNAWWPERHTLNSIQEEIEAESVAFLICQRKSLTARAAKYVSAFFERDREIPALSLNAVFQAVNYIEEMGKSRWEKPKKRGRY